MSFLRKNQGILFGLMRKESRLAYLERQSVECGLLLRIQVGRPLGLWSFRLVVAEEISDSNIKIWGEMKGWAYKDLKGLQLDTMQVDKKAPSGVGHLIWAATMAWALDETPCKFARLLAIHDCDIQHKRLLNYFYRRRFTLTRNVGSSIIDLPLRMIWGGAGALMIGDCLEVYDYSAKLWYPKPCSCS